MCSGSESSRGSVAQLVERTTENREVTGSTPVGATLFCAGQKPVLNIIRPPDLYALESNDYISIAHAP